MIIKPTFVNKHDLALNASEAGSWSLMALLSTLSVGFDVLQGIHARRTGADPTTQETDLSVRSYLTGIIPDLRLTLTRLRITMAHIPAEANPEIGVVSAQRFDLVMRLHRFQGTLHLVHQRMLSLYPDVSEPLIEAVRLLEWEAGRVMDSMPDRFVSELSTLIEQGFLFLDHLEDELYI